MQLGHQLGVGVTLLNDRKILIVLHQEQSTPGRVGRLLRERGFSLDIRRPPLGDPLPDCMDAHAGAVIFGGPMSANDTDDWVRIETEWIGSVLAAEKPFLGLCLGAQMLACQLGGRVEAHPDGQVEIGYRPIKPTPAGEVLMGCATPWPERVYHWHREGFEPPASAEILASGDVFAHQAFRYGRAYGLQFHPEVTYAMMCCWTVRGHDRLSEPGACQRPDQLAGWFLHDAQVRRWLDAFLDHWLQGEEDQPCLAGDRREAAQ